MYRQKKRYFPTEYALLIFIALVAIALLLTIGFILERRYPSVAVIFYLLRVILGFRIIASDKSERAKLSWLILLIVLPRATLLFYLVSSRPKETKREKRREEQLSYQKPRTESFLTKNNDKCNLGLTFSQKNTEKSECFAYSNTAAEYIASAEKMKELLILDIKKAKSFVFLEFYTMATGEFFADICDALIERAAEGVEVRLIYDELGSLSRLPEGFQSYLEQRKICAVSHSSLTGALPCGINNRNHRKIAIIDGEIAYTGGINIADEYITPPRRLGCWKDSAIRLEGEAVCELVYIFLSDFARITGEREDFFRYYKYRRKSCRGGVSVFADAPSPLYKRSYAKSALISMLSAAKCSFFITTPYLICDKEICGAIERAVGRGVRVMIAIPSRPDRFFAWLLTRAYAERLSLCGAEIYLYTPGFLHSKNYLADDKYLLTGTVNLDYRSLEYNYEVGVLFENHPIITEAKRDIEDILKASKKYESKKRSPLRRAFRSVLDLFSPLF